MTVLSLEQAMTLPFLTMRLAGEGMRVIRVENPPHGDPNRWVGKEMAETERGMGTYYLPNNLGKLAITLNLALEAGRNLLHRLIRELPVDIFATNQRPRAYARLGIDEPTLRQLRPDLIWLGITGFGPDHDEAAYDPILQARAGFMDLTGEPDGTPTVFGLPMVDLGAAEHAYGQVMRALFRRAATGQGSKIEISMFQSALSWMNTPVLLTTSFHEKVSRRGNLHPFFAPVSVYPSSDGHVYIAVGNDRQWEQLTSLPGFESLAEDAFRRNAGRIDGVGRLNGTLSALTQTRSTEWLVERFQSVGIPISRVQRVEDVCADPLVADRLVRSRDVRTGIEIRVPGPPVLTEHLLQQDLRMDFPPRLGEHNALVFGWINQDADALRQGGVV
jgi:formyl-CoA transferase